MIIFILLIVARQQLIIISIFYMLELKCEERFAMGSTYDYNKEIQLTLLQSTPAWVKSRCSIRRIIRSVSNLIKINPLEACLLSWLLSKSKYDIQKISIESRTNIVQEQFDHKVLVFMLMNAYYVKEFVCESIDLSIDDSITTHIPNFKDKYRKFSAEKSLKTLTLSDINRIFDEWTCRAHNRCKTDYNNLVDKILYLSKTYNVGGQEEGRNDDRLGLPKKRRKNNKRGSNGDEDQIKSDLNSAVEKEKSDLDEEKLQDNRSLQNEGQEFNIQSQERYDIFAQRESNKPFPIRNTRQLMESYNPFELAQPSPADNFLNSQYSLNNPLNSSLVQSQSRQPSQQGSLLIVGQQTEQSVLRSSTKKMGIKGKTKQSIIGILKRTDSQQLM